MKITSNPIRAIARATIHACFAQDASKEDKIYAQEELHITELHHAAYTGSLAKIKALFQAGADLNATDAAGWTPLHDAVIAGHEEIAHMLLKMGARVNIQDIEERYTPLHEAARMGNAHIAKLLLDAGAEQTLQDAWGNTPLAIAQHYQHLAVQDLLEKSKK